MVSLLIGCGPSVEDERSKALIPSADDATTAPVNGLRLSTPEKFAAEDLGYDEENWGFIVDKVGSAGEVLTAHCGEDRLPVVLGESMDYVIEKFELEYYWSLTVSRYTNSHSGNIRDYEKLKEEYRHLKREIEVARDKMAELEEEGDAWQKYREYLFELEYQLSKIDSDLEKWNDGEEIEERVDSKTVIFPLACKEPVIKLRGMNKGQTYSVSARLMNQGCSEYAGRTEKFDYNGRSIDVKMPMEEVRDCHQEDGVITIHTVY